MKLDFIHVYENENKNDMKKTDPFQSDYFNENLFEINLRKSSSIDKELKVSNLIIKIKNDMTKTSFTNEIVKDFKSLIDSINYDLKLIKFNPENEEIEITKSDKKMLIECLSKST
jgi:hypothetical protein